MDYHIFRKPKKLKNKTVHRWYYYFYSYYFFDSQPIRNHLIEKCFESTIELTSDAANRLFE